MYLHYNLLNSMEGFVQKGSSDFRWVLKAPCLNGIISHEDDKSDEPKFYCLPIELTTLKEAYRLVSILSYVLAPLIASLHTYSPPVAHHMFRILCTAIELTDIHGKQRALDAVYKGTDALLNLSCEPVYGSTIFSHIYVATGFVDDCTSLQCTTVLCLRLLCIAEQRLATSNQLSSEHLPHQKLLNTICVQVLNTDWIKKSDHRNLKLALVDFTSYYLSNSLLSKEKNSSCLHLISNVDDELRKFLEVGEHSTDPLSLIIPTDMLDIQCKSIVSKVLSSSDPVHIKEFLEALKVKHPVSDSVTHDTVKDWIVFTKIWSGLSNFLNHVELKDLIQKLSIEAVHIVFDYLTESIHFTHSTSLVDTKKVAIVYFGLRLLSSAVITIQDFSVNDTSVLKSLVDWLKNLKAKVKCDEKYWIYLCGAIISLLCSLIHWFSTVNVMSSEELSSLIVDFILSYLPLDDAKITLCLSGFLDDILVLSGDGGFCLAVKQHIFLKLFKQLKADQHLTKSMILLLCRLSACILCAVNKCPSKPSLYCTRNSHRDFGSSNALVSSTDNNLKSLESLFLFEHIDFLSYMFDNSKSEKIVDALMNDFAVYLASHIQWNFLSIDQIRTYLILILKNLCRFTPPVVRKIFEDTSQNLSKVNLNSWITVHKTAVEFLCTQLNEKSADLSVLTLAEYHIMIYGALGCCLANRYADFMFNRKLQIENHEFFSGRMSSEMLPSGSSSVTSTQLIDLFVSILSTLCQLGLMHQYTHAVFGSVYMQIQNLISLLRLPRAQVLRLSDHQLAQVIVEHMDQSVFQTMESLSRLFRVEKRVLYKELIAALFIALVLRGNQESHLRIRQLISEVPYLDSKKDYVSKIVQLCVLPETLVYIFTRTSKDDQAVHLAFLEAHLNMSIERIARLNDISRLMHQFILRLYPYRVGTCLGLRWISSLILPQCGTQTPGRVPVGGRNFVLDIMFAGYWRFFDNMLLNDDVILEHRWTALRSLVVFIQLLGPNHVTRMRAKFMANLKICLRYNTSPFAKVVVKAWRSFIRMLEPESLDELLPDLGATLVGLLSSDADQVVDLFHYLFLEKREQLGDRLSCLFFLPRLPSLLTCQQILDDLCPWRASCFTNESGHTEKEMHQLLSSWLPALTHSSRSVRRLTLTSEVNFGANDQYGKVLRSRLWICPT
ncbi:unnamed protein product [Heterobilharzia americana]|nr:unnamed protein product [Heterobilharzia americana]